jgi:uncharacterized protein (TIGR00369 family)
MRKIINPWKGKDTFNCFGCDDRNPIGLKLEFYENGDELVCHWNPAKNYEGYVNTIHGGIQSTLHDEIASWTIYVKGETAGVTLELNVKFVKAVLVSNGLVKLTSRVKSHSKKTMTLETKLFQKNELCSEAEVTYRIFTPELAKAKMHYPGIEAFFEK